MLVSHVAVTSLVAPYIRVLKCVGEAVSVVPLPFPSPEPLSCAAFSPDDLWLIAGSTSSPGKFFIWTRPTAVSDVFTLAATITLPTAVSINDLAFVDDHVIAIATSGVTTIATITPGTFDVSYVTPTISTGQNASERVWPVQKGRQFFVSKSTVTINNSASCYYHNGTTWVASTNTAQVLVGSFGSLLIVDPDAATIIGMVDRVVGNTVSRDSYASIDKTGVPPLNNVATSNGKIIPASERPVGSGTGLDAPMVISRDRGAIFRPLGAAPYLMMQKVLNFRGTPIIYSKSVDFIDLGNRTIAMAFVNDSLLLVGMQVNTIRTGRVRGFIYRNAETVPMEQTGVSQLFDDWAMTPTKIVSSNGVTVPVPDVSVYDSTVAALVNGEVDLSNIGFLLLNSSAAFNAAHTTMAAVVGANEAYGSSWPQGGITASSAEFVADSAISDFRVVLPSVTMSVDQTWTFRSAVLFDKTNNRPLAFIRYAADNEVKLNDKVTFEANNNSFIRFKARQP